MAVRFRLGEVLAEREMSQTDLSRASGVSLVTVNAMVKNRTEQVRLSTLDKICSTLGVSPGDLLSFERDKPKRGRKA